MVSAVLVCSGANAAENATMSANRHSRPRSAHAGGDSDGKKGISEAPR